jgi:hypothetical protein
MHHPQLLPSKGAVSPHLRVFAFLLYMYSAGAETSSGADSNGTAEPLYQADDAHTSADTVYCFESSHGTIFPTL